MHDLKLIREQPDVIKEGIARKYDDSDIDNILELDNHRREILHQTEALKAERNRVSGEIARKKKAGETVEEDVLEMKKVGSKDQCAGYRPSRS